jgi:hypothetical protein
VSAKPVPEGEYADLPGVGSLLVHIDDDRAPVDDEGVLVDGVPLGENPLEAGRDDESSPLGGYPAVAERELGSPDEPVDGADVEGVSVKEDDGVVHTESRELESLDE